jgi:hypothetical protein
VFRKDAMEYYRLSERAVFEKALQLYRQALQLDPKNFQLATELAVILRRTSEPHASRREASKLLETTRWLSRPKRFNVRAFTYLSSRVEMKSELCRTSSSCHHLNAGDELTSRSAVKVPLAQVPRSKRCGSDPPQHAEAVSLALDLSRIFPPPPRLIAGRMVEIARWPLELCLRRSACNAARRLHSRPRGSTRKPPA